MDAYKANLEKLNRQNALDWAVDIRVNNIDNQGQLLLLGKLKALVDVYTNKNERVSFQALSEVCHSVLPKGKNSIWHTAYALVCEENPKVRHSKIAALVQKEEEIYRRVLGW